MVPDLVRLARALADGRPLDTPAVAPALVRAHGLGPLSYRAGAKGFRGDFAACAIHAEQREALLREVRDALAGAGVPAVPFKGMSLAARLYPEPALRPMSDVDVLVPPDARRRAREVLFARGFEEIPAPPFHHAAAFQRGRMLVDLHHGVLPGPRGRVAMDEVWARVAGGFLDPDDELCFHMIGLMRAELVAPLVQLVDAALLLRRSGDPGLAAARERARRWRVARGVDAALWTVGRVMGPVTPALPAIRRPRGVWAPSATEIATPGGAPLWRRALRRAALADGPRELVGTALVSVAARPLWRQASRAARRASSRRSTRVRR